MTASRRRALVALAFCGLSVSTVGRAWASNVTEVPDNGSEQMGRGGAWVARASDPLATFFNPAGLAGQETRLTLQSNFILHSTCFSRIKAASDRSAEPLADPATGAFPQVCNDTEINPNPQLGAALRISDKLTIGFAVMGPAAAGNTTWPDFVKDKNGTNQASPSRYLLLRRHGVLAFPGIGFGYEVAPGIRLGAAFQWGFADLKIAASTVALNIDGGNPTNDVRANIQLRDYFIPGGTFGALVSPIEWLDVAAWYRVSDAVRATGDVGTLANYYTAANAKTAKGLEGLDKGVVGGDTSFEDCGTGTPTKVCGAGDNARVTLPIPMEAKLGVRYHMPRVKGAAQRGRRDPMADDVFDAELDLTWAHNSAIDAINIRFPALGAGGTGTSYDNPNGDGALPVSGIPGGVIPPSIDQPRGYKDVIGVRVGGDVNVLPDRLALRAGGFFESNAGNPRYQNIDFVAASRVGLSLGGTLRIRTGKGPDAGALDLMLGFMHVFVATQDNKDPKAEGLSAVAGTPCNPATNYTPGQPQCIGGSEKYRTNWPVNLGTITNALNVLNVGASYKF